MRLRAHMFDCAPILPRLWESDTAADCEAAATGLGMVDVTPDFIEGRIRSPGHVGELHNYGCCIPGCFRTPIVVHHPTHSPDAKARGLKCSDAYCVPLCDHHHKQLHAEGAERRWWDREGVDPFPIAAAYWRASMARGIAYSYERRGPRRPFKGRKKAAKERKPIRPMRGFD